MSIVTVHGPNTMYSKAIVGNDTMTATVNSSNGMIWTFRPKDQTQVAANYDWAYTPTGGTPASPVLNTMSPTITFSGADGPRTVTLTLNNVAQPPLVVQATSGAVPMMMMAGAQGDGETVSVQQFQSGDVPDNAVPVESIDGDDFDPGEHTVAEIKEWAEDAERTDQELLAAYDAEVEGKARTTVLHHLESMLPYDPAEYSVPDVVQYAEDNPDQLEDIIAAEQAGKNRSTLLSHLEAMKQDVE